MTSLDIDHGGERRTVGTPGFWRRQFSTPTTSAQKIFDVVFGVGLPVLCFVFDPIVFKSTFGRDDGLFPEFGAYAYLVSGIEMSLLLIWIVCGRQLQLQTGLLGGTLLAGAVVSGLVGVIILPFSIVGLLLGIGIFGFTPFLTALVYLRNGKGALQLAASFSSRRSWAGSLALGCVLVLVPPAGLNLTASLLVSESMNAVVYASPQSADMAIDQIRYLRFFARPDVDRLVNAYAAENEPRRKGELKRRYFRLTGDDIETRLRKYQD